MTKVVYNMPSVLFNLSYYIIIADLKINVSYITCYTTCNRICYIIINIYVIYNKYIPLNITRCIRMKTCYMTKVVYNMPSVFFNLSYYIIIADLKINVSHSITFWMCTQHVIYVGIYSLKFQCKHEHNQFCWLYNLLCKVSRRLYTLACRTFSLSCTWLYLVT